MAERNGGIGGGLSLIQRPVARVCLEGTMATHREMTIDTAIKDIVYVLKAGLRIRDVQFVVENDQLLRSALYAVYDEAYRFCKQCEVWP